MKAIILATAIPKFAPPASNSKNFPPFIMFPPKNICLIPANKLAGKTPIDKN